MQNDQGKYYKDLYVKYMYLKKKILGVISQNNSKGTYNFIDGNDMNEMIQSGKKLAGGLDFLSKEELFGLWTEPDLSRAVSIVLENRRKGGSM